MDDIESKTQRVAQGFQALAFEYAALAARHQAVEEKLAQTIKEV